MKVKKGQERPERLKLKQKEDYTPDGLGNTGGKVTQVAHLQPRHQLHQSAARHQQAALPAIQALNQRCREAGQVEEAGESVISTTHSG